MASQWLVGTHLHIHSVLVLVLNPPLALSPALSLPPLSLSLPFLTPPPALSGVLWSISPKLVVFLLTYALLGTFGTAAVFGAPLTRLKQKLLRLEADLRFGLVRLRCVRMDICVTV